MKIVILDGDTMGEDIDFSPILNIGETIIYAETAPEQIKERISDADVVIINKVVLGKENLSHAKKLKLICVFAIGFNNIDIDYCRQNNIKVRNVPGYCVKSVCQHTFATLLSLIENIRYYDDYVKNGLYEKSGVANHLGRPFYEIDGKKWGIIGMGAIGRAIADVAASFGADVSYSSISGAMREEKYPCVDFETLISQSDIISLSAPLNSKTENLIGEKEFNKMKKSAVIVNVGRGALIDEKALADAIDENKIMGAAIDVYSCEPPQPDSPLLKIKNKEKILFTPHIAWSSVEARKRCVQMTADNITAFYNNEKLHDVWE